jgi:hypothetical protein
MADVFLGIYLYRKLREECILSLSRDTRNGRKFPFLLGTIIGYSVDCIVQRSVVSARVLYDDNPTVDLTQIQSALRNNQSTSVVYKQEKVVSFIANHVCPVDQTSSCHILAIRRQIVRCLLLDKLVLGQVIFEFGFPLSLALPPPPTKKQ